MGGSNTQPPKNDFGLLGFDPSPPSVTNPNSLLGNDFLGFGGNQPQPIQKNNQNLGGFSFDQPQPVKPPQSNNNLGGFSFDSSPVAPPAQTVNAQKANNPNKFLAYDNQHLQIWMNCVKENQ